MSYALCQNCSHWENYLGRRSANFKLFHDEIDISQMGLQEMEFKGISIEDVKIECQKCGGSDVQLMKYPPAGATLKCEACMQSTKVRAECPRCKRRVCEGCFNFREDRCRDLQCDKQCPECGEWRGVHTMGCVLKTSLGSEKA